MQTNKSSYKSRVNAVTWQIEIGAFMQPTNTWDYLGWQHETKTILPPFGRVNWRWPNNGGTVFKRRTLHLPSNLRSLWKWVYSSRCNMSSTFTLLWASEQTLHRESYWLLNDMEKLTPATQWVEKHVQFEPSCFSSEESLVFFVFVFIRPFLKVQPKKHFLLEVMWIELIRSKHTKIWPEKLHLTKNKFKNIFAYKIIILKWIWMTNELDIWIHFSFIGESWRCIWGNPEVGEDIWCYQFLPDLYDVFHLLYHGTVQSGKGVTCFFLRKTTRWM